MRADIAETFADVIAQSGGVVMTNAEVERIVVREPPEGPAWAGAGTPLGKWEVTTKLSNPEWTDPRSGQYYAPDDAQTQIAWFESGPEEERRLEKLVARWGTGNGRCRSLCSPIDCE